MCDPATLTIAATVVSATGAAYQGYSAYTEANYRAGVADNNAALSREQAADAVERGEADQQRKWREISQIKASQIAAMAASGIDTSGGSAADLVGDTAVLGTEDVKIIAENAARETRGFHIQAQNFNNEAHAQRRAGTNALIGAGFNVATTILGGATQLQNMKLPTPKTPTMTPAMHGASAWGAPYIKVK